MEILKRYTDRLRTARDIRKNLSYGLIYAESRLRRLVAARTKNRRRVLIMRMDGIGDCILFYPTLHAYREYYKDAEITLVLPGEFQSLSPILHGFADNIIWFEKKFASSFLYRRRILMDLAKARYDVLVYPVFARETIGYFIMKIIGAKESIGWDGDMSEHGKRLTDINALPYTKLIKPPKDMHLEIDRDVYFAEQITGEKISVSFPTIDTNKLPKEQADALFAKNGLFDKKYAVIFPGAGAPYRIWPSERFAQIINHITNKGIIAVMAGNEKEKGLVQKILSLTEQKNIIDISGQTNLPTIALIISKAQFYFGSETGIMHLAVAVGTPTISIVGSGGLNRFFPYGDPKKNRAVYDKTRSFVRSYTIGDWSDAHFLKPGEIHPSIKNISAEDAEKEIDFVLQYRS